MTSTPASITPAVPSTESIIITALQKRTDIDSKTRDSIANHLFREYIDMEIIQGSTAILVASCVPRKLIPRSSIAATTLMPGTSEPEDRCDSILCPDTVPVEGLRDAIGCLLRNSHSPSFAGLELIPRFNDRYAPRNLVQKINLFSALAALGLRNMGDELARHIIQSLKTTVIDLNVVQAVKEHLPPNGTIMKTMVNMITVRQNTNPKIIGPTNYTNILAYARANEPLYSDISRRWSRSGYAPLGNEERRGLRGPTPQFAFINDRKVAASRWEFEQTKAIEWLEEAMGSMVAELQDEEEQNGRH